MLNINKLQYKPQTRTKDNKTKEKNIRAFDTENRPGKPAAVVSSSDFESNGYELQNLDDCLKFLCKRKHTKTLNIFYNLDYDVRSIFKHSPEHLEELYIYGETTYQNYKISYIPDKLLNICFNDKYNYKFYDIFQYFNSGLNVAVKRYLGEDAHEFKGERDKLFDLYTLKDIKKYCEKDADQTKRLGEYLMNGLKSLDYNPKDLISVGSISKDYCIKKGFIPVLGYINDLNIIDYYYKSYRGGQFEIQKRGFFKEVYGYDLVSAYPKIIRELPDISKGEFKKFDGGDEYEYIINNYKWGCARVKVQSKYNNLNVNPIAVKIKGVLAWPVIDRPVEKYLTFREIRTFKDIYEFEIIDGYYFEEDLNAAKPFQKIINDLFAIKKKEKEEGRKGGALYMVSKLIMNSIYGNTIQTTEKEEGINQTGNLFNPFYAAEITAYCRSEMFEAIKDNLDDVIMIATDGVFLEKPLKGLKFGEGLGEWEEEYQGKPAIFLGSGIYQFEGEESKGRGIGRQDFFKELDTDKSEVILKRQKVLKAKEVLKSNIYNIDDINKFIIEEINYKAPSDERREWNDHPYELRDLLKYKYISNPVPLSILEQIIYKEELNEYKSPEELNLTGWENFKPIKRENKRGNKDYNIKKDLKEVV